MSKILYGEQGQQIFKIKEEIDIVADAMNSALQHLYMQTCATSDHFDISDFRTMLISVRSFLEGKSAGSDDML